MLYWLLQLNIDEEQVFRAVCHCPCRWLVLDTDSKDLVTVHTDGNEQLSVMSYGPGELIPADTLSPPRTAECCFHCLFTHLDIYRINSCPKKNNKYYTEKKLYIVFFKWFYKVIFLKTFDKNAIIMLIIDLSLSASPFYFILPLIIFLSSSVLLRW